jgi:hypothetical protein
VFLRLFDQDGMQQSGFVIIKFDNHEILVESSRTDVLPGQETNRWPSITLLRASFLRGMRSNAADLQRFHLLLLKPCHDVAISRKHGRAGNVQSESAILNRSSDCHSEDQDRPAERIQLRNQSLRIGCKNDVKTSQPFFGITLPNVLDVSASSTFVCSVTSANCFRALQYGTGNCRGLRPLEEPITEGAVSTESQLAGSCERQIRHPLVASNQKRKLTQKSPLILKARHNFAGRRGIADIDYR